MTGLHLPASHSITADSARGSVGGGHVGGRSQAHGPTVTSGYGCGGETERSRVTWTFRLTDCMRDGTDDRDVTEIAHYTWSVS